MKWVAIVESLFLLAIGMAHGAAPAILRRPGIDPDAFRLTAFATNLFFPYGMARLPDGSLMVGTSRPRTEASGFFASQGELIRLVDSDGDGIADAPPQALTVLRPASGEGDPGVSVALPGVLVDVRVVDNLAFVVSAEFGNEQILFLRVGTPPDFTLTYLGEIRIGFPWVHHQTYGLIARPSPAVQGRYDVFFNVGALFNRTRNDITIPTFGLATNELHDASIYRMTLDFQNQRLVVSDLHPVATGTRNAAGLVFDPSTGDLWFTDNGIDPDPGGPQSADELNLLRLDPQGGPPPDFGYPSEFVELETGITNGVTSVQPLMVFREVDGEGESEGPAQLAWAPPGFPSGLNRGVFIGFHGGSDAPGAINDENAVVYADTGTGRFLHFLPPGQPGVGHLDGLMASGDSLFLADLTGTGSLSTNRASGVIYQIKHVGNTVDCGNLPSPSLRASFGSSDLHHLRISWDARMADCHLEATTSLIPELWEPVEEVQQLDADERWVRLQASGELRYFRLRCSDCAKNP